MARITINNIGTVGINLDLPPDTLPPEVWTAGKNVRFRDGKVQKFPGDKLVFDPPSVAPYWAMPVQTKDDIFWLYMGLAKANNFKGGTHTDITRVSGDYTGAIDNYWDGGVLGGIPVINNGVDIPQIWSPVTAAQKLIDLANFPASTTAKILKPFRNYLIAMQIVESGTEKPHMVWWSHSADPGTIPNSWDHADATKDAGRFELTDVNAGIIQDGEQLGEVFIIYKDNATHGLQFTGGQFIFRRFDVFTTTGILAQRCVVALPVVQGRPTMHFVATGDDIIVHDGRSAQSVLDKRMRKFLNGSLDPENYTRSYMVLNPRDNEVWFNFPEKGATHPTTAIVWNYVDGGLGTRELKEAAYIASGAVSETITETWTSDSGTWDSDSEPWGRRQFNPQELDLLQCDPTNTKFLHLNQTNQFNGVNMNSSVERSGIALAGVDRQGNPVVDLASTKLLKRIWLRAEGDPFTVSIGAQNEIDGPITWAPGKIFTPGVDSYLDFTVSGRLLAVRFESFDDITWEIHGYDIEVVRLGST